MRSTTAEPPLLGFNSARTIPAIISPPIKPVPRKQPSPVRAVASTSPLGRRELVLLATTPFLLPYPNSAATAVDEMTVIKEEIGKVITKIKAAGFLRFVFHDAGTFDQDSETGGMNGSIVYELDRPENTGLAKSVKILQKVKNNVDAVFPVSWADLIAVAGAEAVSICRGPNIPVRLGRIDATIPDPEGRLPEESLVAAAMRDNFQKKGFTTQELVALSGAHTIGGKGFGLPTVFDNSYYKILLEKPWSSTGGSMSSMIGLPSDRALVEDDECMRWISKYAGDQDMFFKDFTNAYVKLVNSGAKWKR